MRMQDEIVAKQLAEKEQKLYVYIIYMYVYIIYMYMYTCNVGVNFHNSYYNCTYMVRTSFFLPSHLSLSCLASSVVERSV